MQTEQIKEFQVDDVILKIADVFLIYTLFSPIILNIIGSYITLSSNFLRTFLLIQGPGLVAVYIYLKRKGVEEILRNKYIVLTLVLLTVIVTISSLGIWDRYLARQSLKFFAAYCLFGFFIGMISKMTKERTKTLQTILVCFCVMSVGYGLYLISLGQKAGHLFTFPGELSARTGLLFFFFSLSCFGIFSVVEKISIKVACGLLFLACIFFGVLTASRSGIVVFIPIMVLYGFFWLKGKRLLSGRFSALVVTVMVSVMLGFLLFSFGTKSFRRKIASIGSGPRYFANYFFGDEKTSYKAYRAVNRLALWKDALVKFKENPISGSGFGGTTYYHEIQKKTRTHPHSIVLQFLVETGLLGFFTFIFFLGLVLRKAWGKYRSISSAEGKFVYMFYLFSFSYFLLFSCFNYAIHENYYFWYFGGMMVGFDTQNI